MIPRDQMRRLEIRDGQGDWVQAEIGQTEPGDTFRLFEPDGSPVVDGHGASEFVAESRPMVHYRAPAEGREL